VRAAGCQVRRECRGKAEPAGEGGQIGLFSHLALQVVERGDDRFGRQLPERLDAVLAGQGRREGFKFGLLGP
jgi:hypothetical protein